jgi:hypothetical protein
MSLPDVLLPQWLPVPNSHYEVSLVAPEVRTVVRYDRLGRRVGGRQVAISGRGTVTTFLQVEGGTRRRERSVRALQAEAVEAWLLAHPEATEAGGDAQ